MADMRPSGYLAEDVSGIDWLIDVTQPEMQRISKDLQQRTPTSPVDVDALLEDIALLPRLIRERHVFVLLGRCDPEPALDVVESWRRRVARDRPSTWGDAVGDVVPRLQEALQDNHLTIGSNTIPRGLRANRSGDDGPAWESEMQHGSLGEPVSVVRIRSLDETFETTQALHRGSGDDTPWDDDRIVVDLRGNGGGDDSFVLQWAAPHLPHAFRSPPLKCLNVGDKPLMVWNHCAFLALQNPSAPPPAALEPLRHMPSSHDEVRVADLVDQRPTGGDPWTGRMLVLVDGATASSGESAAWILRESFGARLLGGRTMGLVESANLCLYVLPHAGLVIGLPSQWVQLPEPAEFIGMEVDREIDVDTPTTDVVRQFDTLWAAAEG